jgi:hypothetical protein
MSLLFIHQRVAYSLLLLALIAGIWGIVRYAMRRGVDGNYWSVLGASELLVIVQGVLGILLWLRGLRPAEGIHLMYGAVGALVLPVYYGISHGEDDRRSALRYGCLCLLVAGVTLRAISTAG